MARWIICIALILLFSIGAYFSGRYFFIDEGNYFHLNINSKTILHEIDEKYVSVALDVSFMRCLFHKLKDSDWETLKELSSLLSPAYIRFGGTDADRTIFNFNSSTDEQFFKKHSCEDKLAQGNVIISGKDWIKLNKFAQQSGLSLIIDLNVLLRTNSRWNSSNAEALIKFSQENSFPLDFQLGNEPNSFPHVFNTTITGAQLSQDFGELRKLLDFSPTYKNSKLIGPDITRPKNVGSSSLKFLSEFLSEKNVVDVASWHQYYLNGHIATLEDFINPKTFDLLLPQIEAVTKVVRNYSEVMPIWISETSTAYGGGAPKLSNRFAASFLWLDKLGLAAQSNMSVVIRQSLIKDSYGLISENLMPTPDFWITVLYKQLVGSSVLNVKTEAEKGSGFIRFYCHCLAPNTSLNGSLVIYGLNLNNQSELFVPSGISVVYPVYSYIFRSQFNNLTDKSVLLNNRKLMYKKTIIHDMLQMAKTVQFPLALPSYSIGFWVLKEATKSACLK